jgi:hypothetical protein
MNSQYEEDLELEEFGAYSKRMRDSDLLNNGIFYVLTVERNIECNFDFDIDSDSVKELYKILDLKRYIICG